MNLKSIKKYITITSGKKPTTATTPPIIPSTKIDDQIDSLFKSPATHSWNISSSVTRPGIVNPFLKTIFHRRTIGFYC